MQAGNEDLVKAFAFYLVIVFYFADTGSTPVVCNRAE